MRVGSAVRQGVRSLARTPLRSFLVLQGIAWGVGIAIFPAAVLEGSRDAAVRRAGEVGTGRVSLAPEPGSRPLTEGDAAALAEGIPGYLPFAVAPFRVVPGSEATGPNGRPAPVDLLGTGPAGARVRDQAVAAGRYLGPEECAAGRPVCVLEPRAARGLFGAADPVGGEVAAALPGGELRLRVVGVLAPRSATALRTDDLGMEVDHRLYGLAWRMLSTVGVGSPPDAWKRAERGVHLPATLLPRPDGAVDWILARTRPSEAPQLADAVRARLVERGAAPVAYTNMVWPILASDRIEHYMRLKDALVAACLAMGAVVIANVMLLALLERTAEIAVRRAEGATRADIAVHFLVEAAVLGAAGAALGVPLGMGLAAVRIWVEPHSTLAVAFPAGTAAGAAAVAVLAAVVAGVLPARRAARLDPAEALRAL